MGGGQIRGLDVLKGILEFHGERVEIMQAPNGDFEWEKRDGVRIYMQQTLHQGA